jgi:type I restriction enzyme S subunit
MIFWQSVKLDDIVEFINGGAWNQSEYSENGIPVVRVSDIHEYTIDLSNCKYLPKSLYTKYKKHELLPNDLIICTVGSHPTQPNSVVGRPGIVPKSLLGTLLNQNAVCIRAKSKILDQLWLGYFAKSDILKNYILSHARGSASQVRIAIGALKDLELLLPPIATQQKIASILSSYDDVIENNNRRIAILEEMARSLYREWFVKFRFPGHEVIKMVDSKLGKIPEGWRVVKLFDTASPTYGYAFKSSLFNDKEEGIPVVRIRDILKNISNTFTPEHPKKQDQILKNGDLLIGMDGDFHMGKWAGGHAYLNQRVVKITPKERYSPYFTFLSMEKSIKELNVSIVGTTVAHLGDSHLKEIQIILPEEKIRLKANAILDLLFKQEINLRVRNQNLKTQRDMLLPKLVSGKINLQI